MVKVTFDYEPDEPDAADDTGMSQDEYERLMMKLDELGAGNVVVRAQHE